MALRIADVAYKQNVATVMPRPENLEELVSSFLYHPDYVSNIPKPFDYPENHEQTNI